MASYKNNKVWSCVLSVDARIRESNYYFQSQICCWSWTWAEASGFYFRQQLGSQKLIWIFTHQEHCPPPPMLASASMMNLSRSNLNKSWLLSQSQKNLSLMMKVLVSQKKIMKGFFFWLKNRKSLIQLFLLLVAALKLKVVLLTQRIPRRIQQSLLK